jgi:glyceraldehyde 3-phosphate dehydrogenase
MTIRVAINGFGRIGRSFLRVAVNYKDIQIVALNDLIPPDNLAYLLKYDSIHGRFQGTVDSDEQSITVNGQKLEISAEKDPSLLPWKRLGVDYILESSGHFTKAEDAKKHLTAGAKRVIISAPAKGDAPYFVMGVNQDKYNPANDFVVSNGSCTTNCLTPLAKILGDKFGIVEGLMTTIHSQTASQLIQDGPSKKNWRMGRAAGLNIIPASTGCRSGCKMHP